MYTIAEMIGGYLGMFLSWLILGSSIAVIKPGDMTISVVSVFFLEVFFSMTMMLTILHCKNAKLTLFKDNVPGFLAG